MPSQMLIPSPPGDVAEFSHPEFRTQSCPEPSSLEYLYTHNVLPNSATQSQNPLLTLLRYENGC